MLRKQARCTPTLSIGHQLPNKDLLLKTDHLRPGDCISLDQYQSSIPGRLEHTYEKEKKEEKYTGGTIFVDHASGLMYLRHQVSLRVGETLKAKFAFEQMARDFSISIKKYHADNMLTEFRQPLQVQSHLEMPGILVQLGHIQRT